MFNRINSLNSMMLKFGIEYSIYDFQDCYTMNELISSFLHKINEVIDDVNSCNLIVSDFVKWCKEEGLIKTVHEEMQKMIADKTLEKIINKDLFATLDTKITSIESELKQGLETNKNLFTSELKKSDDKIISLNSKVNEIVLNVKDFGVLGNANYFNKVNSQYYQDKEYKIPATNDGVGIQKAIDKLIEIGGGTLYFPVGNYLVSDTIFINPIDSSTPIQLKGSCPCPSIYYHNYESGTPNGSRIICNSGIVFSVNRLKNGNQSKGGSFAWFEGFSCDGLGFTGVPVGTNVYKSSIAFYFLGTRFKVTNCGSFGLDSLVYTPLEDVSKKANYCDLCEVSNIYAKQTQKTLIRLTRCDLTKITRIYHEEPTDTFKNVIEVVGGVGVEINTILNAMNVKNFPTNQYESGVVTARVCKGIKISNVFTTRNINLNSMITLHNCDNAIVENINENGLDKNNQCTSMFYIKSCDNLTIKNVTSFVTRKVGCADFKFEYGETRYKTNITIKDVRFRTMEKGDKTESNRLPIFTGVQYVDKLDYKDIKKIECTQTDSKNFTITTNGNLDLTPLFGKLTVSNDKVYFGYNVNGNKNPILHMCFDVKRKYVGDTLQHEPLIKKNTDEELSIVFINDNKIMTTLDTNVSFTLIQI